MQRRAAGTESLPILATDDLPGAIAAPTLEAVGDCDGIRTQTDAPALRPRIVNIADRGRPAALEQPAQ
ncbi:hypothetical protein K9B33_16325 [Sphingobium sp. 3R8]|uniref:hypothetical protein n=1 Tax=Sphingobium sp. 3R8 TaxID=2874921 RepID=UPI001CCD78DD|nr:hypothetical protein [Sphingobium sp. 3R8]MBZ9649106.1 hypothetical protein [Sphingobium sp. 3R8]